MMALPAVPLVCAATLDYLEDSLDGESSLVRNFVCRYVDMWPARFNRISEAVTAGHREAAMDAALSLRSSSMMVGAAQLGSLASDLVRVLETGCDSVATKQLAALHKCGNQTARRLSGSYASAA